MSAAGVPIEAGAVSLLPEVSVCMVNWRTDQLALAAMISVRENPPNADFEIILVDNEATDFSLEDARKIIPRLTYIANEENRGFAAAVNQAVEASSGEIIILMNPDICVLPLCLTQLRQFTVDNPEYAACAPQLVYPDDTVQPSCRGFPAPGPLLAEMLGPARLFPRHPVLGAYRMRWFEHNTSRDVDQPMASLLAISRRAWDDIGSFDESFPIFFNDVDWCMRARERKWRIRFLSQARAVHAHGQSTRLMGARRIIESHRSLAALYRKHYRGRVGFFAYWAARAAIWISGLVRRLAAVLRRPS